MSLADLWAGLGESAVWDAIQGDVRLTGSEPGLPSSFYVAAAAQASLAAAASAALALAAQRGMPRQGLTVNMAHAAAECSGYFAIDGRVPDLWDKYSGVFKTRDGWVRIHANFAHHRDVALGLLGLQAGEHTTKADVEQALQSWSAQDFEDAAAAKGGIVARLRTREQWLAHPQSAAVIASELVQIDAIENIAKNVQRTPANSVFSSMVARRRPLESLRVLDLTRIIAGPTATRTLAAYGADVLMINGPHLPNIEAVADMSRGKRSAQLDARTTEGAQALNNLVAQAHVWVQGYRPGALDALGFSAEALAAINPNLIVVELSAYGWSGPWSQRRGFDSIVQTGTGLNADESAAAGVDLSESAPKAFPVQILDYAAGYLLAFGAQVALLRQLRGEAAAQRVRVSLARVAEWVRSLGRQDGLQAVKPDVAPYLYTEPSGFGQLTAMRHAAVFENTKATWTLPSMPPGSHAPSWS
jgi:hypothetical protein